jgi:2'-5' RNA ligase
MRLFVAVDVDDDTRAGIGRLIDALRAGAEKRSPGARISWIPPDRLHLTLQFVGEVPDDVADVIASKLRPAFDRAPFAMGFGRIGTFPASGRPRVVWLGVERGAEDLSALQADVTGRLTDVPFRRESRAFSAHLALGRFKDGGTRADREWITAAQLEPAGGCTIDHVTLYQSRLSPQGPTYTPLLQAPLSGSRGRA